MFVDSLSAQKAIFIADNMAMAVGGHTITVSLPSNAGGGEDAAAGKRRKTK